MKFDFQTSNLDKILYKRVFNDFIFEVGGIQLFKEMRDWVVRIRPSSMASQDPFFHGQNGIGGVTGLGVITVYLHDIKEALSDFMPYLRTNSVVVTHETSHAILIQKGFRQKVPLKYDDFGGNKAGTMLAASTAYVHDLHTENKFFDMKLERFSFSRMKWILPIVRALDIKELV